MLELKPLAPKTDRIALSGPQRRTPYDPKQRRLMLVALGMLLVALGGVLYGNRDFWFPDTQETESEPAPEIAPALTVTPKTAPVVAVAKASSPAAKSKRHRASAKTTTRKATAAAPAASAPAETMATSNRTVLPPLEVEVIAGDTHRTVRPGSNSVRVDLQPGSAPLAAPGAGAAGDAETAANLTNNAAERVQMSADTAEIVTHPVSPGYPLLARQMKVEGSVILQALIGKDGVIQDLHVVSGPPILASAAQAAVRQWHFKPHYQGNEPVETEAKITVNFTISTN